MQINMATITLLILIVFLITFIKKTNNSKNDINITEQNKNNEIERYKNWEVQSFFTNQELIFYKQLLNHLKNKNIFLLSKVRIADLVKPNKNLNRSEFMKIFLKLSQKHIDYVLTDYNWKILCLIELDWKSHSYWKTLQNDKFKNEFFDTINIPLLRFKNYSYHNLSLLDQYILEKN